MSKSITAAGVEKADALAPPEEADGDDDQADDDDQDDGDDAAAADEASKPKAGRADRWQETSDLRQHVERPVWPGRGSAMSDPRRFAFRVLGGVEGRRRLVMADAAFLAYCRGDATAEVDCESYLSASLREF
ncbi:MAG: hypothetical protein U0840_02035 [Gemmataceae bacterium]